ncbi:carbohydrate-binding protein [Streptomyces sp. NPDC006307]|uniref:carbohydrate-binding protein n=1 Tax=Streptomyces sp. NPDC006307 TaxID=3156748 RepID=UPI0033BD5F31
MAAGNNGNGAGTPEDDDPFGYLYADGQAAGAQAPRQGGYGYPGPAAAAQPGVPRTSYNQVRAVGERQYGGGHGQGHGQVPPQRPTPQYAAPETYGAPPQAMPPQAPQRGGRGGGPNTKGLLIGAIAVVLVVVIGITVAVLSNTGDKDKDGQAGPSAPASQVQESPSSQPSKGGEGDKPKELPKQDAATLQLGGPARLGTDVKGAKGINGAYVMFNGVGGSASWTVDVPEDGEYTLFLTYSVPGKDADASLSVNGEAPREIRMKNFAHAPEGDWEKGWTYTYSYATLKKGVNTMKMSCEPGDQCEAYLDQVWLKQGQVKG